MKKIISVVLAAILAFSALAVSVSATGDFQTYYVEYEIKNNQLHIEPLEGYSQYVLPGESFKFRVLANENYTTTFTIVEVNGEKVEPDIHDVYTITDIQADQTVTVYLSTDVGQSNLFSSLIVFVHNILAWLKNIFEEIIKGTRT